MNCTWRIKCKKVFENWFRNELTESILVYYNGNSNLSSVRHTVRSTKSNQSKRSLTGSDVHTLSTIKPLVKGFNASKNL